MAETFVARDGDVLVVAYPEIKIPVVQYGSVTVGGLIYTRQLQSGDDPGQQHELIYAFLKSRAEADARRKVQTWADEMNPKRAAAAAPKPNPAGAEPPPPAGTKPTSPRAAVPPLPRTAGAR